ncbi:MAG: tetratricopeptide repeat protein [Bryobacterales bacterium]|nr:tetratricopeptide repeat protein [Bryobacterales bacterium]
MALRLWPLTCLLACIACSGPGLEPLPEIAVDGLGRNLASQIGPHLDALRADSGDASAAGKAGMLLQAYERHDLAVGFLRRAAALDARQLRWPYYLGISLSKLGRGREAAESFRECLRLDGDHRPAKHRLAAALLASGTADRSREIFQELVAADPGDARALHGLARAELAAGRPESAVPHLLQAVHLSPEFGQAHYALALAYRALGEDGKADPHFALFDRHRQSGPAADDPLAAAVAGLLASAAEYLKRGVEAMDAGRPGAAIALHLDALREDPSLTQAHVNLVILYGSMGRPEDAARQYRSALEAAAPSAELHYNYGVAAYRSDDRRAARRAFQSALDLNPDHALANHNFGQMLEEEGRFEEARAHYERALASRPDHALSHYKLGLLWMRELNAARAVAAFREAAKEQSERTPTYLFSLAAALLAAGDRDAAVPRLREARGQAERLSQPELVAKIDETLRKLGA